LPDKAIPTKKKKKKPAEYVHQEEVRLVDEEIATKERYQPCRKKHKGKHKKNEARKGEKEGGVSVKKDRETAQDAAKKRIMRGTGKLHP